HWQDTHNLCIYCNRTFIKTDELQQHLPCPQNRERTIVCPGNKCIKRFYSGAGLLAHLESGACRSGMNRPQINRLAVELDTNRVVTNPARLLHGPDGPTAPESMITPATALSYNGSNYECFLCHREFAHLAGLNQHLTSPVHEEKIYRCPEAWDGCGAEFSALSVLCAHVEGGSKGCKIKRFNAPVQSVISTMAATLKGLVL
ncbi:hypothetical protein WOLCODRAFT_84550, partial [Wolfiporia cocos MD-104 SS10]